MQQIINFIIKNSYRLLFLLLLFLSLTFTIQSHSYHKSKVISSANFFTGGIYEKINNSISFGEYIDNYFNSIGDFMNIFLQILFSLKIILIQMMWD